MDVLFQRLPQVSPQEPSPAWAAAVVALQHLDPWAAWAEGEAAVVA